MNRTWRLVASLSVLLLLLAGSDVCMLSTCPALAARADAGAGAHDACGAAGAATDRNGGAGAGRCDLPCTIHATLEPSPEPAPPDEGAPSPALQPSVTSGAVTVATRRAAETPSHAPPGVTLRGAAGIRAPPLA